MCDNNSTKDDGIQNLCFFTICEVVDCLKIDHDELKVYIINPNATSKKLFEGKLL